MHSRARRAGIPGSADFIVGTSAGSMVGALVGAGVPPWFMVAHSRGESFTGADRGGRPPRAEADRAAGAVFRVHRGLPGLGPGSLRMAATALANPLRHPPLQLVAGWLPAGVISTDSLKDIVRRAVPGRWVEHPNYWAVDLRLRHRQARALRPRGLAAGGDRRRRGGLLRHPRLLPPGARSAAAATWTAACARRRTSTCSPAAASIS